MVTVLVTLKQNLIIIDGRKMKEICCMSLHTSLTSIDVKLLRSDIRQLSLIYRTDSAVVSGRNLFRHPIQGYKGLVTNYGDGGRGRGGGYKTGEGKSEVFTPMKRG